jgi:hypothetical protein
MQRSLFLKIVESLTKHNPYFVQKKDAAKRLGFLPLQKATEAMRMLAYGYSADSVDEYLQIGVSIFSFIFLVSFLSF